MDRGAWWAIVCGGHKRAGHNLATKPQQQNRNYKTNLRLKKKNWLKGPTLQTKKDQRLSRGMRFRVRGRPSSPTETRFRKFSTITSWYSFLWAESSNPSSSSVKATATSLKVTASYNKQYQLNLIASVQWKRGSTRKERRMKRSCSGSCAMCRLLSPLLPSCQHHTDFP